VSPTDPTHGGTPHEHGHTPPDDADDIAAGVGTRLAEWTIALRDGREPTLDDPSDPVLRREFERVRTAVAALAAASPPPADVGNTGS